VSVGVVLNQRFEVDVKVGENSPQKSHVGRDGGIDFSASELGEDIAPAAVSEKKHDSVGSVSGDQLQPHARSGILMVSVGNLLRKYHSRVFQTSR
jgi:hypothetical protein